MIKVYLALGTNLGNKKENINKAIAKLESKDVKFIKSSPIYTTPALLLPKSPSEWNIPFLNCVIETETQLTPNELLKTCKEIETEMGRDFSKKWAPRPIDIDILFYSDEHIETPELTIPHKEIENRSFVLDPLSWLAPDLKLDSGRTILEASKSKKTHQPVFMGILNITPDSFSDGRKYQDFITFKETFDSWCDNNVGIIDIGAESTRPGAIRLTVEEELERLEKIFKYIKEKDFGYTKPLLSIDTYKPEVAKKAIENGFDIVNDVNGLNDPKMLELAKNTKDTRFVIMHSLTVPADKKVIMSEKLNPVKELHKWLENKTEVLIKNNISLDRIIFDPGIGFGKNAHQSFEVMKNIEEFQRYGMQILVGHSRKSFLNSITNNRFKDRDIETTAISMKLAEKGVDILRIHTPLEHQRALLSVQHII